MRRFQFLLPRWRWTVLVGVVCLALHSPVMGQNGKPGGATSAASDPAFNRYVDVNLLAEAWENKNPGLLTDLALQIAEGERVLLRPCKTVSADQVFGMAVKIAAEKRDQSALERLAKVLEASKKTDLAAEVALAQKLASASRAYDPALIVQADKVSPGAYFELQGTLDDIASAKIAGDAKALQAIVKYIPDLKGISEAQKKALLKEAKEAGASLPKDGAEVDPTALALNKLLSESRTNPPRRPSAPHPQPQQNHPPQHVNRPPQPIYHPPQNTYHPPQNTYHPPQNTYHPPQNTYHPPQNTYKPPQNTYHPPQNTYKPPQNTYHPPQNTKPSYNKPPPPVVQNTYVKNNTVINNVTNVNYTTTVNGFVVGGNTSFIFTSKWQLDPGEVIVSIGGMSCANSNQSLQAMLSQAYQSGNLSCQIQGTDGNVQNVDLDPADGGDGGGDGGNDGGGGDGLAGVTMVGSENLGNYGRLEFRFQDNGQVTMIDTDGASAGTYSVDGNTVTLSFYNGSVVYTGGISSTGVTGTARNDSSNWTFTVSR